MLNGYTLRVPEKHLCRDERPRDRRAAVNYFIDDGFVAWINGVEVFRENVDVAIPTPPSAHGHQPADRPAPFTSTVITPIPGVLQDGTNLIAVQVFNTSLGSSDLGFDASLESLIAETNPPVIASVNPPPHRRPAYANHRHLQRTGDRGGRGGFSHQRLRARRLQREWGHLHLYFPATADRLVLITWNRGAWHHGPGPDAQCV